ncbi:MAG: hypothetical protein PUE12_18420 [Oscillospiraceae bacterium]|nr:hypothetical protein [Oscillospiraceae bacterium]
MKDYVFNEKKDIEDMIKVNFVDENNPTNTIKRIARYNHYVCNLDKDQSYNVINEYMRKNCNSYSEVGYYMAIQGCVKDATKRVWRNISQVIITKQELATIRALNDDRQEKLAFVLLADAKYENACKDRNVDYSNISIPELYKLSRVTMPVKDRNMFLSFLYDNQLVQRNINPDSSGFKLLYVHDDDETALLLSENNYKELAFTYMNWKYGGYKECRGCGRLFKPKGNAQYCKSCTKDNNTPRDRFIKCVDCGEIVEISEFDNETCRCEKHRKEHLRELKRLEMQRYRAKKKNM